MRRSAKTLFVYAAFVLLVLIVDGNRAQADRVSELSTKLNTGQSDSIRVRAAHSLGASKDTKALKPLVIALRDKNSSVRLAAATALGNLGDSRALPALQRATRDTDKRVRKEATAMIGVIRHNSSTRNTNRSRRVARIRINGREAPRLNARKPKAYVVIRSTGDESKAKVSKKVRSVRSKVLRSLMQNSIGGTNHFTVNATLAAELKLPLYNLDLSITRLDRVVNGPWVEMQCEIRVAISNRKGRMISFLTGGAKTQVPRKTFKAEFEASMRKEALTAAVKGVHADLLRYLVKNTGV